MSSININHTNIYYELHGKGRPLVLIAGFGCDHTFWTGILHELANKFQVLIFDNRGVGQTKYTGDSPLTLENMAEDTMAMIERLGLVRPHIVGQSMGGAIAQIIAKKYPEKIDKLVILNSVAKFNTRSVCAIASMINLGKQNISLDVLVETRMPWFYSNNFLSKPKNITMLKEVVKNNPYPQTIEDQESQYQAISLFDSHSWLHEIAVDTLVIAGEEDIICLPEESKELASGIPNAKLILIPGAHSGPMEQPKEVNRLMLNFLLFND